MWRFVVNSFRLAIMQTARIAFRAFFVVRETARTCGGWLVDHEHIRYISWMQRSRLQSGWRSMRREQTMTGFLCTTERSTVRSILAICSYILRTTNGKRTSKGKLRGKLARKKTWTKEAIGKRENMRRRRGRIFTIVALRTESHFKSTQLSAIARIR